MHRLKRSFYTVKPKELAVKLLGKILVRRLGDVILSGIIVETEAYGGREDPASHAHRGKTRRNASMFLGGGYAYVYFTYGNHYCFNVTANKPGKAGAVLIRAIQPLEGIEEMARLRGVDDVFLLASGPGRLCKAMAIDKKLDGVDLTRSEEIFVAEPNFNLSFKTANSPRIGVSRGWRRPWRFYMLGNPFVSRG